MIVKIIVFKANLFYVTLCEDVYLFKSFHNSCRGIQHADSCNDIQHADYMNESYIEIV